MVSMVLVVCGMGNGEVGSEDRPMRKGFLVRYQSEYPTLLGTFVSMIFDVNCCCSLWALVDDLYFESCFLEVLK